LQQYFLTRQHLIGLLERLESAPKEIDRTFYLPPGLTKEESGKLFNLADNHELVLTAINNSKSGAVLLHGQKNYLILPPFPIAERTVFPGLATESLRNMLDRELKIGVLLVRLGFYAIGWCQGGKLIGSKVGSGLVHSRHRQGGSSAGRFRRHREKQIESFLTRICEHAHEKLESEATKLDYFVYGGAWNTIDSLQKECPFLAQFNDRLLPPLLDTPKPNNETLHNAIKRVWSSQVIEFEDE
jgi:peptide subunit release factor 1 (eRF1)